MAILELLVRILRTNSRQALPLVLASLVLLAVLPGCSESVEKRSASKFVAQQSDRDSARGPGGAVAPQSDPNSTGSTEGRIISSLDDAGPVPVIERISGYKTAAEYFILPSKKFPHSVAVVTLPQDYGENPDKKYPLVIAFGGAGECARPPKTGALAWMHYYKSDEAIQALGRNYLEVSDFRGLIKSSELEEFNNRLKQSPYAGVILVCPYSPLLSAHVKLETPEYEAYIVEQLVPALRKHYRVAPGGIGVDGVSMGGARSLYYGLKYPEIFGSIGSVQGAFGPYFDIYEDLLDRNRENLRKKSIQIVTSDGDSMAISNAKMHSLLESKGIPHRYVVMTGPHDYIFNQGPGSLALLTFHNQAPRRELSGPKK